MLNVYALCRLSSLMLFPTIAVIYFFFVSILFCAKMSSHKKHRKVNILTLLPYFISNERTTRTKQKVIKAGVSANVCVGGNSTVKFYFLSLFLFFFLAAFFCPKPIVVSFLLFFFVFFSRFSVVSV